MNADEIKRLRALYERADEGMDADVYAYEEAAAECLPAALDEIEQLREAIKKAPCQKHASSEENQLLYDELHLLCSGCDCWKRDALRGECS